MKNISTILIANRGEIAVRIIKSCRNMGIKTIVALSDTDLQSLPARMADQVVCIGPAPPIKSYLNIGALVTAAEGVGADAIHPGYGFLAENPELGEACSETGLVLIGPKSDTIRKMGDKLLARKTVKNLSIPVVPGSELVHSFEEAASTAENIGFPLLIKSAAGGGGKGIKTVLNSNQLKTLYAEASAEAHASFGDDRIYIERFIADARHIEVQIIADCHGNIVHLFERDCSPQRRYQKMVEEAPSPVVSKEIRKQITSAAIRIVDHIGYENAGTIEFILDQQQHKFYFLEMNTRIQVEHPVTEMITNFDIVEEQIKIAEGKALSIAQNDVKMTGHAIECRITAESPENNFRPTPGRINKWQEPQGPGIRVDTHCFSGYMVPPYYDSLLAKLIVSGTNRKEAISLMQKALQHFSVSGVRTNIAFLSSIINHNDFITGNIHTRWLEEVMVAQGDMTE
jgi:acetyl-CoA carboxylase biotin carboxylase subunit